MSVSAAPGGWSGLEQGVTTSISGEPAAKLRLVSVCKDFGAVAAVNNVSLDVADGLFLTILGPSGSGKTTLLRMIAGFMPTSAGSIWLNGVDVSSLPPGKREIGMVFQNYALFPHMTAYQNVTYPLRIRKWSKANQKIRADEVLSLVGLEKHGSRYPRELSGGQQQRVALARALAFKPSLLLMDEPLGALDRELRVRMAGELRRLHEEIGNTVLYVTHDREEALTLSDRIAVMREGELESTGSPQELYAKPETSFVASFFGGHNVVACDDVQRIDSLTVRVSFLGHTAVVAASGRLDTAAPVLVSIPSDAWFEAGPNLHEFESIVARVHSAVYMGNLVRVVLEVGHAGPQLLMDIVGGRTSPPSIGEELRLAVNSSLLMAVN